MAIVWDNLEKDKLTIGVVGAGNMGSGIAQKYATEGFRTIVVDTDEAAVERGRARVTTTLNEGVERKIFKPEQRDAILARMTFTADKRALKDAALVVEAIFEDKSVKQKLFAELDQICDRETILGTNTSSFFVDDVAETVKHKDRVVGLHYFYHPAKNRLVEVIAGKSTSDVAVKRAWALQELSGKTPIHSGDAPGFIVNRYFVPWLNESMRIVAEGLADIATVEAAAKKAFGVGMGPFELMNVTGVPITLHAATTLGAQLGAFYAPCDLIRPVVEKGAQWPLTGNPDASKIDTIAERLLGVVFQIATRIVFDERVCSLEDCDLGARVGLRWPKGPFELMNEMGTARALSLVAAISKRYTDVAVPAALAELGAKNTPFDIRVVRTRTEGGVGFLTIDRPDAMNALSELVFTQIDESFQKLENDASVKGIVIEGRGKAFVAGADVRYFVEQIEANDVPRIVRYASGGQDIFRRIDRSKKTVVCKLHGLSLGGGSELALACDYIVASPKGSMGFPETGIGIYPGLGGTQRTARRVGVPLARWLVLSGTVVDAKGAKALGLLDEVVNESELESAVRTMALEKRPRAESAPPVSVPKGYEATARVFAAPLAALVDGTAEVPSGPEGEALMKTLGRLKTKAPLALKAADALVTLASSSTLDEGLRAESAGLDAIFRTSDALTGMRSVGRGRPVFTGA
jgi:enoyl-CoA hydratase/3-hydroxyacyl-CoA dehydrogenase